MRKSFPVLLNRTLSLSVLLSFSFSLFAQPSILAKGDISILAFSVDGVLGKRQVAFVPWVTLNSGTVIKFSDNGFLSAGVASTVGNYRAQEQIVTWTANTSVAPGTIVTMIEQGNGMVSNNGTVTMVNTATTPQVLFWSIAQSGDEIFAYQGNDPTAASNTGTFLGSMLLFGLGYQGTSGTFTGWLSSGGISTNTSYLPSDLSGSSQIFLGANRTGGQYTGVRTGLADIAAYKTAVADPSKWSIVTGGGTSIALITTAFDLGTPLPLTLLGFTGKETAEGVTLQWTTAHEVNTAGFDIERSVNGADFPAIGSLAPRSTGVYTYTDKTAVAGTSYTYRLKMRDIDGQYTYSPAVTITPAATTMSGYAVFPVPASGSYLYVKPQGSAIAEIQIDIVDLSGRTRYSKAFRSAQTTSGSYEIPIQSFPAGIYTLRISNRNGASLQNTKFTVTR